MYDSLLNSISTINEVAGAIENKKTEGSKADYRKDGLLYCGICHEPKEFKFEFAGKAKIVPCLCKCQQEQREEEERIRQRAAKQREIEEARRLGFPDKELVKYTFAADDRKNARLSDVMKRYVNQFDEFKEKGKGLLLYGGVETGKTFFACCIANALIDNGYSCLATNFSRIANTVWDIENKQGYYDKLNSFDLLVLDDLGVERSTDYMQEIVFNIIDGRDRAGLPMIITTNLTLDEIKNPQDIAKQRIYSRVLKNCFPIQVEGIKRRIDIIKRDYEKTKDLLGL